MPSTASRANAKELAGYFRQMHGLLRAGVSLSLALSTQSEQAPGAPLRGASHEMARHIEGRGTWSDAMRAHPGLFSPLAIASVEAGESSGNSRLSA